MNTARPGLMAQYCLLAAAFMAMFTPAAMAGDVSHGQVVYEKCVHCHNITSKGNRLGPHLMGIVGRRIGSVPGYAYSPAMIQAGKDGKVWTEELLASFSSSPAKTIPGNAMRFFGLWRDSDIADLIAYLKTVREP